MTRFLLTILTLTLSFSALARQKVVYGSDNRQEVYQASYLHKKLALSTAGMIHQSAFIEGQENYLKDIRYPQTLESAMNGSSHDKCSQPFLAHSCSGFFVREDTLICAGRCYLGFDKPGNVCEDFKWVFGHEMK